MPIEKFRQKKVIKKKNKDTIELLIFFNNNCSR